MTAGFLSKRFTPKSFEARTRSRKRRTWRSSRARMRLNIPSRLARLACAIHEMLDIVAINKPLCRRAFAVSDESALTVTPNDGHAAPEIFGCFFDGHRRSRVTHKKLAKLAARALFHMHVSCARHTKNANWGLPRYHAPWP